MADDFTKLLEMTARLDERTKVIRDDIAEIKVKHLKLIKDNADDIGRLKGSRAKAHGVLWALSAIVGFVGGERVLEWLGRGQ